MRHFHLARRAGVPAAVVVAGMLVAGPASADVTVSPPTAPQGSGQNFVLHVTNDGTQPIDRIKLAIPDDTPIAEVYPLSVPEWAPQIAMRTLATPLATIHGGTPATETASSITWIAMPGKSLLPGKGTDVSVAVGPLPELSSMRLTVTTTYVGGKPGPAMPPAILTLTPAQPGQTPAGHAHGGAATGTNGTGTTATGADGASGSEDALFAKAVQDAQRGPSFWSIAGWVVAGLVILAGAVMMLRGRHRAEEDDEPDDDESPGATTPSEPSAHAEDDTEDDEAKEPVSAGSKWSYRG